MIWEWVRRPRGRAMLLAWYALQVALMLLLVRLLQSALLFFTSQNLHSINTRMFSKERVDVALRLPSLPLEYWIRYEKHMQKNKKNDCALFPSIYDLEYHNMYWQTLNTRNGTFYLYGAYLDWRDMSTTGPTVRVLVVHNRYKPRFTIYCQLWFKKRLEPIIVRNFKYNYIWKRTRKIYRDNLLQSYLISFILPDDVVKLEMVPVAVSLVERSCDNATNFLRVYYDPPESPDQRRDFAVCVKGLDFPHEDRSVRLIEWIELVRLLGADKIFFYELNVHPNISKVLDYYSGLGVITVTPMTLPGGQPNMPSLQHMYLKNKSTSQMQMDLISYNDCLYRHMYRYRWLALLDIDEVIVPLEDHDWKALMRRVLPLAASAENQPSFSTYSASNSYFFNSLQDKHGWEEGMPHYLHMLQHVYRINNFTQSHQYVKAFHETDRLLTLNSFFPLSCLDGACMSYELETRHARLQHYRAEWDTTLREWCTNLGMQPKRDTALWRWGDALIQRVDAVLQTLGFLPSHGLEHPTPFIQSSRLQFSSLHQVWNSSTSLNQNKETMFRA